MRDTALWLDSEEQLRKWLDMLEGNSIIPQGNSGSGGMAYYLDYLSGGPLDRINAIRKFLGMREVTAEEILKKTKKEEPQEEPDRTDADGFTKITKERNKKR
jgi:hypothetical protein